MVYNIVQKKFKVKKVLQNVEHVRNEEKVLDPSLVKKKNFSACKRKKEKIRTFYILMLQHVYASPQNTWKQNQNNEANLPVPTGSLTLSGRNALTLSDALTRYEKNNLRRQSVYWR